MHVIYDKSADMAYLRLADGTPHTTFIASKTLGVDYDVSGKIIGILVKKARNSLPSSVLTDASTDHRPTPQGGVKIVQKKMLMSDVRCQKSSASKRRMSHVSSGSSRLTAIPARATSIGSSRPMASHARSLPSMMSSTPVDPPTCCARFLVIVSSKGLNIMPLEHRTDGVLDFRVQPAIFRERPRIFILTATNVIDTGRASFKFIAKGPSRLLAVANQYGMLRQRPYAPHEINVFSLMHGGPAQTAPQRLELNIFGSGHGLIYHCTMDYDPEKGYQARIESDGFDSLPENGFVLLVDRELYDDVKPYLPNLFPQAVIDVHHHDGELSTS